MIFPVFAVTQGYLNMALRNVIESLALKKSVEIDSWHMHAAGPNLIAMIALIVFYWLFFIFIESQFYTKCRKQQKKPDVTLRETQMKVEKIRASK